MSNILTYLPIGAASYTGAPEDFVRFTMKHQLLDRDTWAKFVKVFTEDSDDEDQGWRCEYWGKMMRGACLTYMYAGDKALYTVLEEAVTSLLAVQRADGRFSTYSKDIQLRGWDLWGRKYVLTGMLHFYRICKSEELKARILAALCRHADAIINTVGAGEGKIEITLASDDWLGVNSASILEPFVDLYTVTGEKRFLDFASYIISTGGIDHEENLIELALAGEKMPYMYPQTKAYETMSFFEGVLAYYGVTGEKKYLDAVLKFTEAVNDTDITVIGCSGCTHELFDHSAIMQTEPSDNIMQETCVTVTWMRLLARLHLLTGEKKYFDRIEVSAYNALYGSTNTKMTKQLDRLFKVMIDPLPFDSYSPLYNSKRGVGVGGLKRFAFGGLYGCCACIASAGIALFPLVATLVSECGITVNTFLPGKINVKTPQGKPLTLTATSSYPASLDYRLALALDEAEELTVSLRLPDFAKNAVLTVNGEAIVAENDGGYLRITRVWKNGDTVSLSAEMTLETVEVGSRTAFVRGPITLARDVAKDENASDLTEEISLELEDGKPICTLLAPESGELLRLSLKRADGKPDLLLTDYASSGKDWNRSNANITAWFNVVK